MTAESSVSCCSSGSTRRTVYVRVTGRRSGGSASRSEDLATRRAGARNVLICRCPSTCGTAEPPVVGTCSDGGWGGPAAAAGNRGDGAECALVFAAIQPLRSRRAWGAGGGHSAAGLTVAEAAPLRRTVRTRPPTASTDPPACPRPSPATPASGPTSSASAGRLVSRRPGRRPSPDTCWGHRCPRPPVRLSTAPDPDGRRSSAATHRRPDRGRTLPAPPATAATPSAAAGPADPTGALEQIPAPSTGSPASAGPAP
jgi:hypothetical protein